MGVFGRWALARLRLGRSECPSYPRGDWRGGAAGSGRTMKLIWMYRDYVKITKDYTLEAAKAFSGLNDPFKFVYVSGMISHPLLQGSLN